MKMSWERTLDLRVYWREDTYSSVGALSRRSLNARDFSTSGDRDQRAAFVFFERIACS